MAEFHRDNFCSCRENAIVDTIQAGETNFYHPSTIITGPKTRKLSKNLLKRLLQELLSYGEIEGELIQRGFKYKRPRDRRKRKDYLPSSSYIGVSRNGTKWQALLLVKSKKLYLGTLENEEETAMLHDQHSILNFGIKRVSKERKHDV